eukprot:6053645-Pleurochrysis_carterae.AAC.1
MQERQVRGVSGAVAACDGSLVLRRPHFRSGAIFFCRNELPRRPFTQLIALGSTPPRLQSPP